MKKVFTTIFGIAIIMIIIGVVMMIFGGESISSVSNSIKNDGVFGFLFNRDKNIFDNDRDNKISDANYENIEEEYEDIDEINIESSVYSLYMKSDKDAKKIKVNIQKPILDNNLFDINISQSGNTLRIEQPQKNKNDIFKQYESLYKKCKITIIVPDDEFDKLYFDVSVGYIELKEIKAEEYTTYAGVGDINIYDSRMKKVMIKSGVGDLTVKNTEFDSAECFMGVGSIKFDGDIEDKLLGDIGTGSADVKLNNKEEDYNFDIQKGVGSLSINGKDYKKDAVLDNDANCDIELKTGVGSIDIKTK